jgi:predicted nucleic acid-binding protein
MILVDTSVWVRFLRQKAVLVPEELFLWVTCGPILQEVVQGLRDHPSAPAFRDALLALPRVADPVTLDTYLHAAEIYRLGRRKGYTIRSSIDCLLAAIAIENAVPIWHHDRDFEIIARYTSLEVFAP